MIYVPVEEEIRSICYSDKYAAVIVDSTSGSPYRLDVYNTDGKKVTSIDFDYAYTGALIDGDRLILYNEVNHARVTTTWTGTKSLTAQFDYLYRSSGLEKSYQFSDHRRQRGDERD